MKFKVALKQDMESVYSLWQRVFNDDEQTINTFFSHIQGRGSVLVCEHNREIISMLVMIESEIVIKSESFSAYYIYAAATDEKYRKKGIMSGLLSFGAEFAASRNVDFLFLRPANESLYSYYQKNGFSTAFYQKKRAVYNNECSYEYNYILWGKNIIELDKLFSDNDEFSSKNGYASIAYGKDEITVKHFVSSDVFSLLNDIKKSKKCEKIYVSLPLSGNETACERTGMIKSVSGEKIPDSIYLGITLE